MPAHSDERRELLALYGSLRVAVPRLATVSMTNKQRADTIWS